ncbi:MAG: DUF4160 domain-containing protein [Elusimicrobia bacterium]|nr:DUF4160 domain-containing protein [Elusimicrobiota bacterium]
MPVISMFYGVIVSLYFMDNKRHKRPHLHVKFRGREAVIAIPTGEIIEGRIPGAKLKLVQAWIEIHKDEVMADWELAAQGQPLFKIEPLR